MTHKKVLRELDQDLDDLQVRNPRQYRVREDELKRLERKANLDVTLSPVTNMRRMERTK